jgi:hypothetical protein
MAAATVHYTLDPPDETTDTPSVDQLVEFYVCLKGIQVPGDPDFRADICPGSRSVAKAHFSFGWTVALKEASSGNVRWDTNAFVPKEWHDLIDAAKRQIDLMTGAYPEDGEAA